MKRIFILMLSAVAMLFAASCQKTAVNTPKGDGYLSFSEFTLGLDEEVDTKATAAGGGYSVIILDAEGKEVMRKSYAEVKNNNDKISLTAGQYTLVARSSYEEVPVAEFETPVYAVEKPFSITAGETTVIGELVCTLAQCKVTVSYSDEFLASVTGPGSTKVTVTAGYPLEFALAADGSYDRSAGYFAVNGSTMEVVFSGSVGGKSQKMTKTFTGISAKQWRQIKFINKKNEQGDAVFDIVIQDLISDSILNDNLLAEETIIGDDPDAPKGDGGITLALDYEAGCDPEITDLLNMQIVPVATREMSIKLRATVPSGVKKFTVDISTTNQGFATAVAAADATHLDLINPSADNMIIFDVVPFPHGAELVGQTDIPFDLSAAQSAIVSYKGVHTFTMTIVDMEGCRNQIPVVMVVE